MSTLPALWGIHNDAFGLVLIDKGYVSIGWKPLGDLQRIPNDQASFRSAVSASYPEAKSGSIPL